MIKRKLSLAAMTVLHITAVLMMVVGPANAAAPVPLNRSTGVPLSNTIYVPLVKKPGGTGNGWPMAGANPQRTSWTPEEVRGPLQPEWFKPFDAYIPPKVQVIATLGMLYLSTANGLYALDAATGAEKWVYPTRLPLSHSPTIADGIAYVGGFDKKLHAVDALTGRPLWTFEAGGGFDASPLVADGMVFIGNRDGNFYAVFAGGPNAGKLAWKFVTGGPIDYSAALSEGDIYFASNDSYAYALKAGTGELVWKSAKLPGAGFYSWWPVIYRGWVIFSGSHNYRNNLEPGPVSRINIMERDDVYPNFEKDPQGTLVGPPGTEPGDWAKGTVTIDTSRSTTTANGSTTPVTEYLEGKPWRRTFFVLDRKTGKEYNTDFDRDGKSEYAPILWLGTKSGNRYPPAVGIDDVLYQSTNYMSSPGIAGGHISGWQVGTPYISVIGGDRNAVDEPQAYAAGGRLIYWNRCCDRIGGAIDVTIPNTAFLENYNKGVRPPTLGPVNTREWVYYSYFLEDKIPGYNVHYYNGTDKSAFWAFGGPNGIYGVHGNQNPPIPYQGRVYMHRSNAVVAFAPDAGPVAALPSAKITAPQDVVPYPSVELVRTRLAAEVRKMIAAGHLRPGYLGTGIFDFRGSRWCGDDLIDYWHQPGETLLTLIRALPHLPADLQTQTRSYLQSEFAAFPPYQVSHIGWNGGAPREVFDLPGDVAGDLAHFPAETKVFGFNGWTFPPQSFYALWMYAKEFGNAKGLFDAAKSQLNSPPADAFLQEIPNVHNAFIAGYTGYLELEKLAGYPESTSTRQELDRLLRLRVANFSKDPPQSYFQNPEYFYCRALNVSRNFMEMTPELASYLRQNAPVKVQAALQEYFQVAPYWFVTRFDTSFAEGAIHHLFDYHALFQAKALILQEPFEALSPYLEAPAVPIGDLYYIQNLTAALESARRSSALMVPILPKTGH